MTTTPRRRTLTRRALVRLGATLVGGAVSARAATAAGTGMRLGDAHAFSFTSLIGQARKRAQRDYVPPPRPDPAIVRSIDYDAYGKIRFDPARALYPDSPYPITLMHVGRFFPKSVQMHMVANGTAREILYDPGCFLMPADAPARLLPPRPSAFAGFWLRERTPHATPAERRSWAGREPWATCLGASYWRAIGELGQVGLSARGIAVDPGGPGAEEFPDFVAHWFTAATSEGDPVVVHSLLDGPSVTGAFRLAFTRTRSVQVEVEQHLFLRRAVARLGIAPLTSMFWFDERARPPYADWRPEVHDSDGLALWTGAGERVWRPLNDPASTAISSFADIDPKGFGLAQRDRDVEHYLDGVGYEKRPTSWVEPLGAWGVGAVQLVELPTDDEILDNIVASWVRREPTRAGDALVHRYRQHWTSALPFWPTDLARVAATRLGRGGEPGKPRPPGTWRFVVELDGPVLDTLWGPGTRAEPVVDAARGSILRRFVEPVPGSRRWRVVFDLEAEGGEPIDLRMFLKDGARTLSETWLCRWRPPG